MHRSHLPHAVSTFVILLAILACALPGQTIQPASTKDPNTISTTVAGTAQAAEQQTQQADLFPPSATVAPTDTMTPTPKISSAGTSLLNLADGSTQFTDHVAGMQMVFPSGWLVVRVGEEEYYAAWEKEEATNPHFQAIFTGIQDVDPKVFRMDALDLRPEHMPKGEISRVEAVFGEGNTWTLEEIKKNETENHPPLTAYKLLSSKLFELPQGIEALNVEIQWQSGETETGYRKSVFFKVPGGNMAVNLIISLDRKELAMPEFDQIISSITLFTP